SFESQFFFRSRDKARAFQAAMGGLERARFAIATDGQMENVASNLGPAGVTYAVAWQSSRDDSTGTCWNSSDPVTIRVLAEVGQDREMLEANFDPEAGLGLYKRLMSLNGDLYVTVADAFGSRIDYTFLQGAIRKRGPSAGPWGPGNPNVEVMNTIPLPDLSGSWWTTHYPGATEVNEVGNNNRWELYAGAGNTAFFRTDDPGGPDEDPNFSVSATTSSPQPTIDVSGTAIWMLPRGAYFPAHVQVTGSGTLVIVARPTPSATGILSGVGIGFRGSLDGLVGGANVNVLLVSSGDVRVEHAIGHVSDTAELPYVSIFARNCHVMGPYNQTFPFSDHLTLTHVPGDPRDAS
ncbi:MAG TPA: hypothetical protein VFV33_07450, partial [Gemmatimonadaceae bacterium]|nr:hypothetical protein [Gemmatimonadaceae bacterium]